MQAWQKDMEKGTGWDLPVSYQLPVMAKAKRPCRVRQQVVQLYQCPKPEEGSSVAKNRSRSLPAIDSTVQVQYSTAQYQQLKLLMKLLSLSLYLASVRRNWLN